MLSHTQRITQGLTTVFETVPLGTNVSLLSLVWTCLSGRLLTSRGALLPALQSFGLAPEASSRVLAALHYGHREIQPFLTYSASLVREEGHWQPHLYSGYEPVAVDLTAFFRPRLQRCPTKHDHPSAQRALLALPFGIIAAIGAVGRQRVPLLLRILRPGASPPALRWSA